MPSKSIRNILYDMRGNILYAQEFVAEIDFDLFIKLRRDIYAETRAIEIISEASKHLPDELRARHPQTPWRDIRDVGNFYNHDYDNVSVSYVWRTVQDHLPSLLAVVPSEIALLDGGERSTF